eukprot:6657143-Pyramimonas_sp.AAC.1
MEGPGRIGASEARVTAATARCRFGAARKFGAMHFNRGGNMGATLAVPKGRSTNFGTLARCREAACPSIG